MDIIKNDFKTIQLVSYHSAPDDKTVRVKRYLLAKLLVSHTNKLKTRLAISIQLEALYGALLSARSEINGNVHTISIGMTIANPYMVRDDQLLRDSIAFFKSLIYDHDQFDAEIFNDEKRMLIEQWQSIKDNKSSYANHKFNELFRLPDLTGVPITGTLTQIKKVTVDDVYDYYKNVFLKEDMHLVVNGDIREDKMFDQLALLEQSKSLHFQTSFRKPHALKEAVEQTDMNQAIIKLGYVYPIYRFDDEYPAAMIANTILGGYPESRLFKEIRERDALCYDISSHYDVYKGTLIISSGVAIETVNEAKKAIETLVDDMIKNGITLHELDIAKTYIIHQLKANLDHQTYFTKKAYYAYLTGHDETVESRIERLSAVSLNAVNHALKQLLLDTTIILKGGQS